jgi:arylformamidase
LPAGESAANLAHGLALRHSATLGAAMTIDYEKEYDNRARVPEHVEIFARWRSDAEAYRQVSSKASPKAELGLKYGPSERQFVDIFPAKSADAPLALFIHGGWWRTLHPREFSHSAAGLNAHGVTVAMAGYDLCPNVSIATITEQMRALCLFLWRKYRQRIMVFGHSAGGHLAACMLATDWKTLDANLSKDCAPNDLVPAAYAISGVFDLLPLTHVSQNADLKLDDASARAASPILWQPPADRTLDCVVGGIESAEFLRQSRNMADAWGARGVATRYEEIPGANHFTVVDPLSDAQSKMTKRVVELAKIVKAMPI